MNKKIITILHLCFEFHYQEEESLWRPNILHVWIQRGGGQEVRTPLENHKWPLDFLLNIGTNPPQGGSYGPQLNMLMTQKKTKKPQSIETPIKFMVPHMFWVVQIFWVNKLISVNCGHNESARKHQNLSTS